MIWRSRRIIHLIHTPPNAAALPFSICRATTVSSLFYTLGVIAVASFVAWVGVLAMWVAGSALFLGISAALLWIGGRLLPLVGGRRRRRG